MYNDPVTGKDFFGREKVLQLIETRDGAFAKGYRQNISLIGQPLIGKSSIICQYLFNFSKTDIIPVYVDVEKCTFLQFLDKFKPNTTEDAIRIWKIPLELLKIFILKK